MEKENLDNLFRESLDEFRQEPDPGVWERIQASLDKKARRRRRVVPLWWQLGGAAAALALLLFLLIPGKEQTVPETAPISNSPSINTPIGNSEEAVDNTQNGEEAVVVQHNDKNETPTKSVERAQIDQNTLDPGTAVASQNKVGQVTQTPDLTENTIIQTQAGEDSADPSKENTLVPEKNAIAEGSKIGEATDPSEATEIAASELEEVQEKKAREELLSAPEEDPLLKPDETKGKWAIGPSIAPVYFNGLGDGSPIDQAFVSNEKSGNFNMSYGLQVSYQVNKRLQIRSGLHKVDFGYNTNDIVFSSSLQTSAASQMKNVDYSPSSEYLVVATQKTAPTKADVGIRNEIAARNTSRAGTMVQEFGYLEVPVELNYAIIDRTIGVHLISGISSLFLVDNTVSLESDSGTTEVGQANNLNDVNFSANLGFGVQYQVNDKIKLQVEPLLKYQLNTFSDTSGQFRPYSIGIYSGIRYKF